MIFCKLFLRECSSHHYDECSHEYDEIQEQGIVLYIVGIEGYFFFEGIFFPTVDLCHTTDTWLDREDLVVVLLIGIDFSRLMWTWSDERHVSDEDIDELREFIEGESFEYFSYAHLPRIIRDFIEWTFTGIIFFLQGFFVLEGCILSWLHSIGILHTIFPVHISELIEEKLLPIVPDTTIAKEYRT